MSTHFMLSGMVKTPEIALADHEAEALAGALVEVQSHYEAIAVDPKTMAWFNLAQVVGIVYGTRVMAIRARKSNERKARIQEAEVEPTTVFGMGGIG